jgi:pyruvate carboxylase
MCGADAIHPGYGLLSENPDFVDACEAAGIAFIGPKAETMRALGDKASARQVAIEAGVPVIPATEVLGDDMKAIAKEADEIGYPLMLKASWGGGGRGMRPINGPDELEEKVREGRREAEAAFGNGEGYLEKMILRARHVEVQILGDSMGNIYHLYERDCSVQRRNQKVVERAPAPYLSGPSARRSASGQEDLRACELPMRRHGRVPDGYGHRRLLLHRGEPPRAGRAHRDRGGHRHRHRARADPDHRGQVADRGHGHAVQYDVKLDGHAIQCRITTEDPPTTSSPITAASPPIAGATGMGIRLDGGTAYSGAVITRYYDSLLEKVTAWAPTPEAAIARMDRALREFRIRGVSTNIAFVENLLKHPTFLNYQYHTKFIDETPELFDFKPRRDRATRILTYIADITVNGHPETEGRPEPRADAKDPKPPALRVAETPPMGAASCSRKGARGGRQVDEGADAASDHRHDHARRAPVASGDAHALDRHDQGRTRLCRQPAGAVLVECWGGATFDVAYRFLQECPWQRLRDIRAACPTS